MVTIAELKNSVLAALEGEQSSIQHDVSVYIRNIRAIPRTEKYNYRSPELMKQCESLTAHYGVNGIRQLHKLVMLELIEGHDGSDQELVIPASVNALFEKEFERIRANIEAADDTVYDWSNDAFCQRHRGLRPSSLACWPRASGN